mmetsp:Transcript_141844/g.441010  ORF Transcript_141844/g.441010 Transcript_141844/m.441010 type:complete len:117 (-) Transcript_141844:354-704(-)
MLYTVVLPTVCGKVGIGGPHVMEGIWPSSMRRLAARRGEHQDAVRKAMLYAMILPSVRGMMNGVGVDAMAGYLPCPMRHLEKPDSPAMVIRFFEGAQEITYRLIISNGASEEQLLL